MFYKQIASVFRRIYLRRFSLSRLSQVSVAPPDAAPSGLTASATSTTGIDLAWTNNATNATSVKIERATDGGSFSEIDSVSSSTDTYSDTVTTDHIYSYRVRAANDGGYSSYSNTDDTPTFDSDCETFFSTFSITDADEKDAFRRFIIGLKVPGYYTDVDEISPFSITSSTAALGKFISLTSMTAVNSPTWATTGFTTDGVSSYINTSYTPNASGKLGTNDFSYWVFIRSGTKGTTRYAMGAKNNLNAKPTYFGNTGASYTFSPGNLSIAPQGSVGTFPCLITGIMRAQTDCNLYRDGSLVNQNTNNISSGTPIGRAIYLMAENNFGTADGFMAGEICFFMAARGANFSDSDQTAINNLIQTFQTALGR